MDIAILSVFEVEKCSYGVEFEKNLIGTIICSRNVEPYAVVFKHNPLFFYCAGPMCIVFIIFGLGGME